MQQVKLTGFYRNIKYTNVIAEYISEPRLLSKGWTLTVKAINDDTFDGISKGQTIRIVLEDEDSWSKVNFKNVEVDGKMVKIAEPVIEEPEKEHSYLDILQESDNRFEALNVIGNATAMGLNNAFIVSGAAGLGKSHNIDQIVNRLKKNGDFHFETVKGYLRATGLYKLLYKMRHENCVLVLDDADEVFRDEIGLNLLKAALDTTESRFLSWHSQLKMFIRSEELIAGDEILDPDVFIDANNEEQQKDAPELIQVPNKFEFKGSVIFITNLDFQELVDSNSKLSPHFKALMSRSHYLNIGMHKSKEKLVRIAQVVGHGMLSSQGISEDEEMEILTFIEDNLDNFSDLSLRLALKLAALMKMDKHKWKTTARMTCMR